MLRRNKPSGYLRPPIGDEQKRSPEAFDRPGVPGAPPEAFGRSDHPSAPARRPKPESPQLEKEGGGQEVEEAPPKPFYKRPVLMTVAGSVLVGAIVAAVVYWLHARHFENTDDAFIAGHVTRVAPRVAGQVSEVFINDNGERDDAGGEPRTGAGRRVRRRHRGGAHQCRPGAI